jgi:hypothetical protein
MSTSAMIMMVLIQGTVVSITGFFFYKVLTVKPKDEPDSFTENDDDPR